MDQNDEESVSDHQDLTVTSQLRFFDGAKPGVKKRKAESQLVDSRRERQKKYELNRTERNFLLDWKTDRDWLLYDKSEKVMKCSTCITYFDVQKKSTIGQVGLRGQNMFVTGCSNIRLSTVKDHQKSNLHIEASERTKASNSSVMQSDAGKTYKQLQSSQHHKLAYLFRNAHAVAKNNRPLSDYQWLCQIDLAKGVDLGQTYMNEKAALGFLKCIAGAEKQKTAEIVQSASFYSFTMDGSTDISGDEQEVIYLRAVTHGQTQERFVQIGTPKSTCSQDLFDFVVESFKEAGIPKDRLVGLGSDGASNMTGKTGGLAALLRANVSKEIVNVHCLAHRLELAFRDVLKKNKSYDKLMTLLIGLHYFYIKQYKNKSGLQAAIKALEIKGVMPPKMTGTRWLPHLSRGIESFLRTYPAYEAHLATLSHSNPKAEGMLKIMLQKDLMCFVLFLKDVLEPLMKLSLRLQRPGSTLADGLFWVETTADLLPDIKSINSDQLSEVLTSGCFGGITLKGRTPTLAYRDGVVDGFVEALVSRFQLGEKQKNVINSTHILSFSRWPKPDSPEFQVFGVDEVKTVTGHFADTLMRANPEFDREEALQEWRMLKRVLSKRHGSKLTELTWDQAGVYEEGFQNIMLVIDILLALPPTSVNCETTFSQMKLVKTIRRANLNTTTVNDLLLVKLESPPVANFNPEKSIDQWLENNANCKLPTRVTADGHICSATKPSQVEFSVPKSTLSDKLRERTPTKSSVKMGYNPILTGEEEVALVNYVEYMANQGFPVTRAILRCYVREIVRRSGRNPNLNVENGPSDKWFRKLLKRHPQLSERTPENLDKARQRMSTQKTADEWFDFLRGVLDKYAVTNKPAQIFNVDESGWSGKEKAKTKVIAPRSGHVFRNKVMTNDHVTANLCISADGKFLPTMIIFQGALPHRACQDGIPDDWLFGVSESGYMDGNLFVSWFQEIFVPNCGRERPVVLILDNHDSHVTLPLVEAAISNDVVLVGLPGHTTHFLQPLDVKVIGPLKARFATMANNLGFASSQMVIGKAKFPVVLKYAIDQATPASIQEAFAVTGIQPFNPQAIDASQLVPPSFEAKSTEELPTATQITCHACGSFLVNPLVSQGLIPEAMAAVLMPPPTKPATEKKKRVVSEGRVLTGEGMLRQLKEKEEKLKEQEAAKLERMRVKEVRKATKEIQEEEKKEKRQKREEERATRDDQKKEKEIEKINRALGGKLADKLYTCAICGVRGRVHDEKNGVFWYGCDADEC